MKNINKFIIGTFFFLSLVFSTQAQSLEEVTPANVTQIVDDIFETHGGHIEENYTTIHEFIDNLLPDSPSDPDYSDTCLPPLPEFSDFSTTSISYSWSDLGSYNYRVSYIKLNNFAIPGTETGQLSTATTDIEFDVSNGMVLIAFQSFCGPTTSGDLKVIIVDKPVFLNEIDESCTCNLDINDQTTDFVGTEPETDDISFLPFTQEGEVGVYIGEFIYNSGLEAKFAVKITLSGDYIYVGVSGLCLENVYVDNENNLLYVMDEINGDRAIFGSLSFNGGFYFDPIPGVSGSFSITECGIDDGDGDGDGKEGFDGSYSQANGLEMNHVLGNANNMKINLSPNPVLNNVSIDLPSYITKDVSAEYYITNIFGEKIFVEVSENEIGNGKLNFSVNGVPNGTYIFVLRTREKLYSNSFVKID